MHNKTSFDLREKLEEYFGFQNFKSEQEQIVSSVIAGRDTFVIMPTGGGKSLCYQLPAMILEGTAIIVSPLIALMKNQVDAIRTFSQEDSVAHFLNSSLNKSQTKKVLSDIEEGRTKLLYIAPETLTKEETIDFFRGVKVSFVAIDEAHCISEWGHDFRPEYRRLREMIGAIGGDHKIPLMALTATATPKVRTDIVKILAMQDCDEYITSFNRTNLYYEIRPKKSKADTHREIVQYIKAMGSPSGIIYVRNRKTTAELAEVLNVNGLNAAPYHAGLDAGTRAKTQDAFLHEEIDVICATIAFGMGIDKPDVRFVIHYDMPKSIENYYQETGRAGRDGLLSHCLAFYSPREMQNLEKFLRDKNVAERELGMMLIEEVIDYAETGECRRSFLLNYFGESYDDSTCQDLCDNCKYPPPKREVSEAVVQLLRLIDKLNENFDTKVLISYIRGESTQKIQTFNYDKNDDFGFGKEETEVFWESVIRQAIIKGLLHKSIERYGVLLFTDAGREYLENPYTIEIALNRSFDEADREPVVAQGSGALDDVLLKMLKQVREHVAKKHGLPKYVIFQDPSLEDMATRYPISMDDMLSITGVNKGKAQKYGDSFVELIKTYVEENNIERTEDLVIKTTADKSKSKINIIQGVDQKRSLEDIATSQGMSRAELMTELYHIVISGTKLDLEYIISEEVDEYALDDIIDYFMESESDDVEAAFQELEEEDITREEIELVRLKFLSDYAN